MPAITARIMLVPRQFECMALSVIPGLFQRYSLNCSPYLESLFQFNSATIFAGNAAYLESNGYRFHSATFHHLMRLLVQPHLFRVTVSLRTVFKIL
jgi:hypothetical protein